VYTIFQSGPSANGQEYCFNRTVLFGNCPIAVQHSGSSWSVRSPSEGARTEEQHQCLRTGMHLVSEVPHRFSVFGLRQPVELERSKDSMMNLGLDPIRKSSPRGRRVARVVGLRKSSKPIPAMALFTDFRKTARRQLTNTIKS